MKFKNKKTNDIIDAYSIDLRGEKAYVKFNKDGREYTYFKENIEIVNCIKKEEDASNLKIYKFEKNCYKCHKETTIYTYIVFDDGTNENVEYPWDKKRLLINQKTLIHMQDPSIEYYGLKVIGDDRILDEQILNKYVDKISITYSRTQNKSYPMNKCEYCGAGQGWYFIYRYVNEEIQAMREIDLDV
ncbi:hypothetical protein [Listeria valentina]|uniref:hypothetical protein n=1 Tax=Listeria valentina TaxID=2705293 RepID=UPI001430C6DD|nr:hypothetical protein [Listeria valentina]